MGWVCVAAVIPLQSVFAAGGSLTVAVRDEADEQTRDYTNGARAGRQNLAGGWTVRKTVPVGVGLVLDRSAECSLPDGQYRFQYDSGPRIQDHYWQFFSGTH